MARPKRPPHPMIARARAHLRTIAPDLQYAPLILRTLDGPPGSPRYAVSVARCQNVGECPYEMADPSVCTVPSCDLRRSLRLLLNADGSLAQVIEGHRRWNPRLLDDPGP